MSAGLLCVGLGAWVCSGALAQGGPGDAAAQTLTVWIVRPVSAADHAVLRAQQDLRDISVYRETTAGSFGRSASDVGQTAGSYGKPASEVGQNAGSVGTNAGDYGQTSGSLASNVTSQTAGSYGMTAGSFGTAASDFSGAPATTAPVTADTTASRDSKGPQWTEFLANLQVGLPGVQVRFVEVYGVDLRQRLAGVANTGGVPDVLLSDRMPEWWAGASRGSVLLALPAPAVAGTPRPARSRRPQTVYRSAYGLAQAPHPGTARRFLEWWYGNDVPAEASTEKRTGALSPAAGVALAAVAQVLSGSNLEALADREMAAFSSLQTRAEVLGAPEQLPADLGFHTEVLREQSNGGFAVVLLHTQCSSRLVYCDLLPLVMLRTDARGAWKVLQLSLGTDGSEAVHSFQLGAESARPVKVVAEIAAPRPASPVDGDQRAGRSGLDLWWDNGSGASLLVCEWQAGAGRDAPASHVSLISDVEGRQRTQLPAPFADATGRVRWRVWAAGQGGMVRLSEWRTVTMVQ